ncbi:hypothetical protein N9K77_01650 [bacterium]|nr:hypothetical protein [bacterium]
MMSISSSNFSSRDSGYFFYYHKYYSCEGRIEIAKAFNNAIMNKEISEAPLMTIYTKGKVISKRAAMVLNIKGGCAMEVVSPTTFKASNAKIDFQAPTQVSHLPPRGQNDGSTKKN